MRAAEHEAAAAQIVLDTLLQEGDVPPVTCFRARCQRGPLPLAQLRGAIFKPSARRSTRLLPGVRGLDDALRQQRADLTAARDAARLQVQVFSSGHVCPDLSSRHGPSHPLGGIWAGAKPGNGAEGARSPTRAIRPNMHAARASTICTHSVSESILRERGPMRSLRTCGSSADAPPFFCVARWTRRLVKRAFAGDAAISSSCSACYRRRFFSWCFARSSRCAAST